MKVKFLIVLTAVAIMLSGCGQVNKHVAKLTGWSEVCIDGVPYLQFASGASVKFDKDGTIADCE